MFHPVYGDLMTAKEVSDATLFTLNQLRNWRNDARAHLAPFGSIQIGGTSYYRKIVVQAWIDRNGVQSGVYRMTELDKEFPIGDAVIQDISKMDAFATLSKITTETVYHWMLHRLDEGKSFRDAWQNAWADISDTYLTYHTRLENPEWYRVAVQTQRWLVNNQQGLGLTLDEIKAMPVGAVPPLKEKK